ncbi:MAG TPA: gluconate 2-dehydrogenase subunit 3 family protein [Puia sp.]|nr:gluconate 2-dehydrogenase subunit 3 family protein [Puia sp.]
MSISRRTAIRQLAIVSAGAAFLPSCLHPHAKPSVSLKYFTVTGDQEKLLEELTATLIPTDSTPGARDVSAHLFTLRMVDDCSPKTDQEKFMKGLTAFDEASKTASGKLFAEASPAQREALLLAIESKKLPGEELNFFYSTAKKLTVLAYSSSQFFLTKVKVYELVPGRFHGCVPVAKERSAGATLKKAS